MNEKTFGEDPAGFMAEMDTMGQQLNQEILNDALDYVTIAVAVNVPLLGNVLSTSYYSAEFGDDEGIRAVDDFCGDIDHLASQYGYGSIERRVYRIPVNELEKYIVDTEI